MPWKQIVLMTVYIIQLIYIIYSGLVKSWTSSEWTTWIIIELAVVSLFFKWFKCLAVGYNERKEIHRIHHKNLIDNVFKIWCAHTCLFNWYDLPDNNGTQFNEFLYNQFDIKDAEIEEITKVDVKTARVFFNGTFLTLSLDEYNTKLSIERYKDMSHWHFD